MLMRDACVSSYPSSTIKKCVQHVLNAAKVKEPFIRRVDFAFASEKDLSEYRKILDCEVNVSEDASTKIWFDSSLLDRSLQYGDKVTGTLCAEQCSNLLMLMENQYPTVLYKRTIVDHCWLC